MSQGSFNPYGAVDLSGLGSSPAAPRARAAGSGAAAASDVVVDVTEADFQAAVVEQSMTVPVVIDFWAEWCGPCKMLAPALDEVARDLQGQAVVAKVNVDEQPSLAARFNIQSIPTLLYFSGGELRDQTVGAVSKKTIVTKLTALRAQPAARQPA